MYDSGAERSSVSDDKRTFDLYSVAEDVCKHWLSILLLTVAVWMFAFVFLSSRQQATYASSATVAVTNTKYATNADTYDMLGYEVDVATKLKGALESKELKDTVAGELGYSGFQGSLAVNLVGDSGLLRITVRSGSPTVSYMEVKSVLDHYKAFETSLSGGARFTILEYPLIQEQPDISSGSMKKAVVAALAVFMLICALLVILSLRRDTIKSGADVVNKTGTEFLGAIYRDRKRAAKAESLITDPSAGVKYSEEIRRLAHRIERKMAEKGQKVLLVTSTEDGEGKSVAAANIAIAIAQTGRKVVLADMDFHSQPMQNVLNLQSAGSVETLTFAEKDGAKGPDEMESVIGELRREADYVIIDAAPAGLSSDAEELADLADTSLLVIRRHCAETSEILKAVSALGGNERMLGCVVSDVRGYSASVSVTECRRIMEGAEQKKLIGRGDPDELRVDLFRLAGDLMQEIRRYCVVILAVMLALGGIFYLGTKRSGSVSSTAHTTFTVVPAETVKYRVANQKNICVALMGKMYPSILTSDAMKGLVKQDLDYDMTKTLPAAIAASVTQNTNLVKLTVTSADPQITAEVMESVLRNAHVISDAAFGSVTIRVMDESEPTLSDGATRSGKKEAAMGMILGLILSLIVLVLKLILSDKIPTEEELTWLLGQECLGDIPWIKGKNPNILISSGSEQPALAEAVRKIRYRVERDAQSTGAKAFLVTSAIQSEGKTTTAVNLALSLAGRQSTILLIDADLRNPSVMKSLGMQQKESGLSDLLAGNGSLEEVLVPCEGNSNLTILPAGKASECPSILWSSGRAGQLMQDLRGKYDLIIIDAPQSAVVSENTWIAELADTCLFIVRRNYARLSEICEGVETFEEADCRFLGCVIRN